MNTIDKLFTKKSQQVLAVYITAGYPALHSLPDVIDALQDAGVDLIEVGMPFSDPMADGEVIQQSSGVALKNGMNMRLMFEQLQEIKSSVRVPLVLMGYLNPVLSFGMENFLRSAASAGVSGIILPDLPPEVYEAEYRPFFEQYGLHKIFLVTPSTSDERIVYLASLSGGFLYAVAEAGVTGAQTAHSEKRTAYLKRVRKLAGNLPVLAGFGIHNYHTFSAVCEVTHGAITGSAFIRALAHESELRGSVNDFIQRLKYQTDDSTVAK
ncbi:MAG: tryptophan synthase subunit alpha [Bacteroidia bacterium]|jgi:tryptophan synthase alpha chain|nr:tryptophan synthase subunit alpha [Bacteroidia bacterium]